MIKASKGPQGLTDSISESLQYVESPSVMGLSNGFWYTSPQEFD